MNICGWTRGRFSTPRPHCLFGQTCLGTRCNGPSDGCRGMPGRGTPARGGARLCRFSRAYTKRFGTKSSCRNTHSVTSLDHAGVYYKKQAVRRYHVCFTVTAAALAGSTHQPVTVLLSERKSRLILNDLPHPPVLRLVHATVWQKFKRSLGEKTTPVR